MKKSSRVNPSLFLAPAAAAIAAFAFVLALSFAGCRPAPTGRLQGYLEGEFVYVAAPLAGRLERLAVVKGARVEAGAPLFTLERDAELAAQHQAESQLRAARARVDDLKKGARPSELASLDARLAQSRAAAELSGLELARQDGLLKSRVISENDFDRARLTHERNRAAVAELDASLATARLGARADAIAAAEAEVAATEAALQRANWSVAQKSQNAPRAAFVFDTIYRAGEFVAAGQPIVALLPPENLKVRFFVPQAAVAALRPGQTVRVSLDGRADSIEARISYLSPRPEYTPPVLYNRDNRAKLVFMIEAVFAPEIARDLHPGQPVDVELVP